MHISTISYNHVCARVPVSSVPAIILGAGIGIRPTCHRAQKHKTVFDNMWQLVSLTSSFAPLSGHALARPVRHVWWVGLGRHGRVL